MKIDFIISTLRGGGAERVAILLAEGFAKDKSHDVSMITLNKGQEYGLGGNVKRLELDYGRLPNHTIRSFVNLYQHYSDKKNRPDIIISFITLTSFIAIPIAKLFSIKIICAEHNNHLKRSAGTSQRILSNFTKKRLYKKADLLTVLTSYDVAYYEKYGAKVKVMPNPCTFKPMETYVSRREKVILAVGKLDRYHHKGFDNLIPIVAPLLKANPDWRLKIIGSGDLGLKLISDLAEKYEIQNQIIFTGFISTVSDEMKKSAIFILPSRFEGLPMVLLEAMSQGMACIAYDCVTGPSDIIEDRKNGILVEDQNQEKMQVGLSELIQNEQLRIELGQNGIKSLDRYNIDKLIAQYNSIFTTMLSKK